MAQTEAQKRAKAKYRKKIKSVSVEFYPSEPELYEHLSKQDNKARYIKNLIRQDMDVGADDEKDEV